MNERVYQLFGLNYLGFLFAIHFLILFSQCSKEHFCQKDACFAANADFIVSMY